MLERWNAAMEHVEQRLGESPGEPVEAGELARLTATSEYHFRRMFSALAGMPLSVYVRRRRLTLAGAEVLAGRESLLDIAVRHGYGSGEAFARAFRAQHGVGPADARRRGAALEAQPRMTFRLVVEGSSSMRYRIVDKPAFRLVGPGTRVPLVHEGMNPAIVEFVRGIDPAVLESLAGLSDQEPRGIVSASHNVPEGRREGGELDYHHGVVTTAEPPRGVDALEVPAGTWAVFESSGEFPKALQHLWRDVFTQWFPSNPYRSRPGPEISATRLSPDGTHADAELWIPVEPD